MHESAYCGSSRGLFEHYDLLARSGLFDPQYYLATNPDVAGLNMDPLVHYIEIGAREGRNPNAEFDTAFYLEQCQQRGERPENPLLHYVKSGAQRGLQPRSSSDALSARTRHETRDPTSRYAEQLRMAEPARPTELVLPQIPSSMRVYVDKPLILSGSAVGPIRGNLTINGWAIGRKGIACISVILDSTSIMEAHRGIHRRDVQQTFPDWPDALTSGFVASIPERKLPQGSHTVRLQIRDKIGQVGTYEFGIIVENRPERISLGSLRQKLSRAEIDIRSELLRSQQWQPIFNLAIRQPIDDKSLKAAQATLASLRRQAYTGWRLLLLAPAPNGRLKGLPGWWANQDSETIDRVLSVQDRESLLADLVRAPKASDTSSYFSLLTPGDELGSDALLEFAAETAIHRASDFWYCDEQRPDPASNNVAAYPKPQWSPDLLLSTNYIGRLWFVRVDLLAQRSITLADLHRHGEYDLVLRCAEAARDIRHIPIVLCRRGATTIDSPVTEMRAVQRAVARSRESAQVLPGCLAGIYRVRRRVLSPGQVSIIIPTCGSRGLIKTCIKSIRNSSTYRDFEVICVDNIPPPGTKWKTWLTANADKVIETSEPFNWSRFNNLAVKESTGKFLLFLNDDVEVTQADWLEGLLEHAQRSEIGAVGPQLIYPDSRVQHAGLFLTVNARARHAFRYFGKDDPGPFGLALTQRNVIGVTGACLMTKRATFDLERGFNEAHDIINNDLDYCLRLLHRGLRNVFTPYVTLIHHEAASRGTMGESFDTASFNRRWSKLFRLGDPYFNPRLSIEHDGFVAEVEPVQVVYAGHPIFARGAIRKILVLKLDHIGDCITALPAMKRLAERFPGAKLHVLAGSWSKDLLSAQPYIDKTMEFDFFHARSESGEREVSPRALRSLHDRLVRYDYDLAVDFRKHPETRHILLETGASYLAGFDYKDQFPWLDIALEWEGDVQGASKRRHISDDLICLVDALDSACLTERHSLEPAWRPKNVARPLICVHPGGGNPIKQWPAASFATLIDLLIEDCEAKIVLIGSDNDRAVGHEVMRNLARRRDVRNLISRVSLVDLPRLLASCSLFVGNDSAPKHIAAGLGVPTVGVHSGVVDAREWGPLGPRAIAIRRDVSCSPCYLANARECNRSLACLTGIRPRDVYNLCRHFLAPQFPPVTCPPHSQAMPGIDGKF
jgi:ADP-heptose:LPS heptosyltransferase/GT2 family glycosyltransferase